MTTVTVVDRGYWYSVALHADLPAEIAAGICDGMWRRLVAEHGHGVRLNRSEPLIDRPGIVGYVVEWRQQ